MWKIVCKLLCAINTSWCVKVIIISACGEEGWCHELFCSSAWHWHVVFMAWIIALLSHDNDNDLLPCKTLIVLSYDLCDSPSITVTQTVLCEVVHLWSLYQYFHQPCDHTFLRGNAMIGFWCCLLVSFVFMFVSKIWTAKQESLTLIYFSPMRHVWALNRRCLSEWDIGVC